MLCYRGFRIDFIQVPLLTGSWGPCSPNGVVLGKFHKTKTEGNVGAGQVRSDTKPHPDVWQQAAGLVSRLSGLKIGRKS